ncbi:MAG: hypothetical protein AB7S26_37120 [Sandaracinaceae bacterium]
MFLSVPLALLCAPAAAQTPDGLGYAADELASPTPAPSWGERRPGPEPERAGPGLERTVFHAYVGGGIALLVDAGPAFFLAFAVQDAEGSGQLVPSMGSAALGALALIPFGSALAAWGWGESAGGTGNFFSALGLGYGGAAIGGALMAAAIAIDEPALLAVGAVLGFALAPLGAAIGYDVTDDGRRRGEAPRGASAWVPYIAPTAAVDGAIVGAVGLY